LVIFDVVADELVGMHVTMDEHFIKRVTIAYVLQGLVVLTTPEDGSVTVRDKFVHHVESSERALVGSIDPVLNSRLLA